MNERSPSFGRRLGAPPLDDDLLRSVMKPARYLGGEVGQVRKDPTSVEALVGLCYPDLYEIGMSHIGLKILYDVVNRRPEWAGERVYAVARDMEAKLRASGRPLTTLENRVPLHALDVLGFTLQYELSYTNLLQVLELGGIPRRAADRGPEHPLVIAGGPCAFNPEPVAPFLDAVCLGDGEETLVAVIETHTAWKRTGESREALWWRLTEVPGVYVPALYTPAYGDDGLVSSIVPASGLPSRVKKAILTDLNAAPYPTASPVPFMQVVHDRVGVEIQRGCMRGCRFCQAGYIYRPERQRSPDRVRELVRKGLAATGQEEYSLLSLSAGDYNCMEPLLTTLMDEHEGARSAISLPSMRLETLTPGIMEQVGRVRKTSFTVAPEAGSDRMRAVINKVIDEDVLVDMVEEVFKRGWSSLKFYFMLGLPTEQTEDLQAIIDLGARCRARARRHNRGANITVSVSSFVPKSHTPFQWAPQITLDEIRAKQEYLRAGLRAAKLGYRYHSSQSSVMEGVFSRGDRRTSAALERAYELGARLDGWQEELRVDAWDQAFEETGTDPTQYNQRRRDGTEVLPWSHIDIGMKPEWLWEDWMDALEAGFVPDCTTEPCYDCGVCDHVVVANRVYRDDVPEVEAVPRIRKRYGIARKKVDPQFVAMPRPPAKKGNNVVDAVPPQGMAPGSAGARHSRTAFESTQAVVEPNHVDARGVPLSPSQIAQRRDSKEGPPDWREVFDTRLPPEWRVRVRVRFGKRGPLVHVGHLDLMNVFRRALKRAEAPVLWSQGFHPQMRVSFVPPLPSGCASSGELMDVELHRPVDVDGFHRALASAMPDDLPILDAWEVPVVGPSLQQSMEASIYIFHPGSDSEPGWTRERVAAFERGETGVIEVVKRKKGKETRRTVDLHEVVSSIGVEAEAARIEVAAHGAGARIREVIAGIFGEEALGSKGATLERAAIRLAAPAPRPPSGSEARA